MGFKAMVVVFLLIMFSAAYIIGGSESVSKKIEQYTEDNYKGDPEQYEKYTFMNAVYCNWTGKYNRTLELLDKYEQRFDKEQYREKSEFLRAKTFDNMIEARKAKDAYKKYMDDFPKGKNFEKARERYDDLKSYT